MSNIVKNRSLLELSDKPTIIISDRLHGQINTLHGVIGSIEWSGVLFLRKIAGDINTPSQLVYRAELLMLGDIGTTVHTGFELDETVLDFYQAYEGDIPDIDELKVGLCHTHHTLGFTRFSGEDMSELQDNAGKHNYYISLIVDNKCQYSAKIALVADRSQSIEFTGTEGDKESMQLVKSEVLVTMDCNVVMSQDDYLLQSITNCKAIQQARKPKVTPVVNNLPKTLIPSKPLAPAIEDDFYDNYPNWNLPAIPDQWIQNYLAKVIGLNSISKTPFKTVIENSFKLLPAKKHTFPLLITDKIILDSYNAIPDLRDYPLYEVITDAICMLDDLKLDYPKEEQFIESIIKVLDGCYEAK